MRKKITEKCSMGKGLWSDPLIMGMGGLLLITIIMVNIPLSEEMQKIIGIGLFLAGFVIFALTWIIQMFIPAVGLKDTIILIVIVVLTFGVLYYSCGGAIK